MKIKSRNALFALSASLLLSACQSSPQREASVDPYCSQPRGHDLDAAFESARASLRNGCVNDFDRYFETLLNIAEGNPDGANKEKFSDFLLWSSEQGLISRRQAQERYNRYFNVKFVTLRSDYNTCSQACRAPGQLQAGMQRELLDKERGLLKVSSDGAGYQQADRLFQEAELVLQATCTACGAP